MDEAIGIAAEILGIKGDCLKVYEISEYQEDIA